MHGRQRFEDARKLIHMTMGGFALLLRFLTWWQAALFAAAALAFNLIALPRLASQLYRPAELTRRFAAGIVLYPISVLLLILVFPTRLDIAAAAWGILAVGDGMATIVGIRMSQPRIPWNREKSVAGSVAFFVFGGMAGAFLAWWCRPAIVPEPSLWFSLLAPFAAALAAAFAEALPIRLDDNVSVPTAAAATMWTLAMVRHDHVIAFASSASHVLLPAAAANIAVAWLGHRAGTVTTAGAVTGVIIGVLIAVAGGWAAWALLLMTFLVASISSRLGLRRKTLLGIAEERGGRRGPGNAIANTGIATVAAVMSVIGAARDPALTAFAAALAAGGSDTVASEVGKAWGRRTYLMSTLRPVPPGTSGAVSVEGTVAGLVAAAVLASVASALGLTPVSALLPIVIGATVGAVCESLMGATLEAPGILNNDVLNFLNTAIAAACALLLVTLWP